MLLLVGLQIYHFSLPNNMGLSDLFSSKTVYNRVDKPLSSLVPKAVPVATPIPAQYNLKDRGVQISDADINAFRPLLYGEVSNRTPDKQALEANVILNTALNRVRAFNEKGQKKTLSDVLAMPNQYQAFGGKQYNAYSNPPDAVSAAKKKQIDAIIDTIHQQIKTGRYDDNTEGAYYYAHGKDGKIAYDNLRPLFSK